MGKRTKKKTFRVTHKYKLNTVVVFIFAGSRRIGEIIELTREENKHATYTVTSRGTIYPCLGLDYSKDHGSILTKETESSKG